MTFNINKRFTSDGTSCIVGQQVSWYLIVGDRHTDITMVCSEKKLQNINLLFEKNPVFLFPFRVLIKHVTSDIYLCDGENM